MDRGTSLVQVRPTTICVLSCIFCSTDAGPNSRSWQADYLVRLEPLLEAVEEVANFKGGITEAHVDTVGDPLTYPHLVELVEGLSETAEVVSIQTHGVLLREDLVRRLERAGLSRINLSIDSMNPERARVISGSDLYRLEKILDIARFIAGETGIDLLIAPVWIPGVNDEDIPRIIEFALKIGAGKRWPPLGIQKYEAHKRGRRPRGIKPMTWSEFYARLRSWEREYGIKLILSPEDFGIEPRRSLPTTMEVGEVVTVDVKAPGWRVGEMLGEARRRAVTLVNASAISPGQRVRARVLRNRDNVYVLRPLYS